jgi:antitoxin (DNA-binding transcriptional repressor) of toxin-antitoxin stability system
MRTVGVKVLKDRLSHYLRLAAAGETVLVTDRDKVVAEMRPPGAGTESALDAVLADAVKKGWLTPPLAADFPLPPRKPVASLEKVLSGLSEDRAER